MVQELIDKLADIEGRKIYVQEQLRTAIDQAKKAQDMINEFESDIYHIRQEIEQQVSYN